MSGDLLQAGGNIVQGIGSIVGGRARASAMRREAEQVEQVGVANMADRQQAGEAGVATATTRAAASGFDVNSASFTSVVSRLAAETAADSGRIRWESSRAAMQRRNTANQVQRQGYYDGFSSFLQAGGNISDAASKAASGG